MRRTLPLLATIAALLLPGAGCQPRKTPNGSFAASAPVMRVTFLDVGQGDSTIIESPDGHVVVIDGGGKPGTDEAGGDDVGSRVVVPFLRSRGISTVDLLVATHPDDDHVQGLIAVAKRLDVKGALLCGYPGDSPPYQRLLAVLKEKRIPTYPARRNQTLDFGGGATAQILSPTNTPISSGHSQTNNESVVLRVVFGQSRFLLTGDAEQEAEADMVRAVPDLSADVYKAGHHGSRWSSTPPLLDRVRPGVAIVSCGKRNTYGHPHTETLQRFAARRIRVFRTDEQGAIVVTTDGKTLHFVPTVQTTPKQK